MNPQLQHATTLLHELMLECFLGLAFFAIAIFVMNGQLFFLNYRRATTDAAANRLLKTAEVTPPYELTPPL